MEIYHIPKDLVFTPARVDGAFWSGFHTLISYLGNLTELLDLKNKDPEQYAKIIEPLLVFVSATEEELFDRGYLSKMDQADLSK